MLRGLFVGEWSPSNHSSTYYIEEPRPRDKLERLFTSQAVDCQIIGKSLSKSHLYKATCSPGSWLLEAAARIAPHHASCLRSFQVICQRHFGGTSGFDRDIVKNILNFNTLLSILFISIFGNARFQKNRKIKLTITDNNVLGKHSKTNILMNRASNTLRGEDFCSYSKSDSNVQNFVNIFSF